MPPVIGREGYCVNELKTANHCIKRLIRSVNGLRDGIEAILSDLRKVYRFSDVAKVNAGRISACYEDFEEWLNALVVSRPMPPGIVGLYFGLYDTEDGIMLYVSGSSAWDPKDPDWACRNDWFPDEGSIRLDIYRDISMMFSRLSCTGYYLAVAILVVMIKEYVANSVISLLDDERQSLCIACGFDDGMLHNLGALFDDGMAPPDGQGIW